MTLSKLERESRGDSQHYNEPNSSRTLKSSAWSGYSFPSLGDLPNPGIEPSSPALWADSLPSVLPGEPSAEMGCLKKTWGLLGEMCDSGRGWGPGVDFHKARRRSSQFQTGILKSIQVFLC